MGQLIALTFLEQNIIDLILFDFKFGVKGHCFPYMHFYLKPAWEGGEDPWRGAPSPALRLRGAPVLAHSGTLNKNLRIYRLISGLGLCGKRSVSTKSKRPL
ncbi:hypothetical protein SKAU_G00355090 [Synaphobranchus kaupii]|uniref:Uncharacterized protein n=1 Tax=Synaphobranchus kaupii TaxID=118154 RepID=A0A9Q1EH49_SYNKA|nr:hypothetical protein SKAU_G00355090 [Synaphobranchus kaupii]